MLGAGVTGAAVSGEAAGVSAATGLSGAGALGVVATLDAALEADFAALAALPASLFAFSSAVTAGLRCAKNWLTGASAVSRSPFSFARRLSIV